VSLSIIIPTLGRESLRLVLKQLSDQLLDEDEIIVIADGPIKRAKEIASKFPVRYFEHGPTKCWGNAQRNYGIAVAEKTHLHFLDDDDQSLPDALATIRKEIKEQPGYIHIFRIHSRTNLIWNDPIIQYGNVSSQMFIIPSNRHVGHWPDKYAGDYYFLADCISRRGNHLVSWHRSIIAIRGVSEKQCRIT